MCVCSLWKQASKCVCVWVCVGMCVYVLVCLCQVLACLHACTCVRAIVWDGGTCTFIRGGGGGGRGRVWWNIWQVQRRMFLCLVYHYIYSLSLSLSLSEPVTKQSGEVKWLDLIGQGQHVLCVLRLCINVSPFFTTFFSCSPPLPAPWWSGGESVCHKCRRTEVQIPSGSRHWHRKKEKRLTFLWLLCPTHAA